MNNQPLGIGAQNDGVNPFKGALDEVRIYNRALSPAEILALATPPPPPTDLSLTLTDDQAIIRPGQTLTYTLVAQNLGDAQISGAEVTSSLPDTLTAATWTCTASLDSSCPASGDGAVQTSVTLAPAGTATFTLMATVAPGASGSFTYQAEIALPEDVIDPVPGNNIALDTVTALNPAPCEADPGLVGCWQMEEAAGSRGLGDGSGQANDAALTGAPTWLSGHSGQALGLDGVTQFGLVEDADSLDIAEAITIAAWVKPGGAAAAGQAVLQKGMGASGYALGLGADGKAYVRLNPAGGSPDAYQLTSTTAYPLAGSAWMHLAAAYDGCSLRLYVNGIEEARQAAEFTIASNDLDLGIGAGNDGTSPFQGALDEVRLYNRALSVDEIYELYGNRPPAPAGDSYSMNEDETLSREASTGVLSNDSDDDGDPLTAILVSGPEHGSLVLNSDGSFTYDPDPDYNSPDGFTYRLSDGHFQSGETVVAIDVVGVNDQPSADSLSANTSEHLSVAITLTGSDVDGDKLAFEIVDPPTHGSLSGTAPALTYTPTGHYWGADSFTYKVSDGTADSLPATVTITISNVNDEPAAADDAYTVDEDGQLVVSMENGLLHNDSDPDTGTTLAATLVDGPQHGVLVLEPNGAFTYTPAAGYMGADSFTYSVSDGEYTSLEATVTLAINPVNHPPTAQDGKVSTKVSQPVEIDLGPLVADVETAAGQLAITITAQPAHGTLTGAGALWTYTPAADFAGGDLFRFTVTDRGDPDGCTGAPAVCAAPKTSPTATMTITVTKASGGWPVYLPVVHTPPSE